MSNSPLPSQIIIRGPTEDETEPRSSLDGLLYNTRMPETPIIEIQEELAPPEPIKKDLKKGSSRIKSSSSSETVSSPVIVREMTTFSPPEQSLSIDGPEPFSPYTPRGVHSRFPVLVPHSTDLTFSAHDKHPSKQVKLFVMEIREDGSKVTREMRRTDILHEVRDAPAPPAEAITSIKGLTQLRDLRHIDPTFAVQRDPGLLVRRHAILVHLNPVEAIILHNKCFIFIPPGRNLLTSHSSDSGVGLAAAAARLSTPHLEPAHAHSVSNPGSPTGLNDLTNCDETTVPLLQDVVDRLNTMLSGDSGGLGVAAGTALPVNVTFEFKALEAILQTVCKHLDNEVVALEPRVKALLAHLSRTTSTTRLERLRRLKIDLTHYEAHARGLKKAISDVLESDEDMAYMNLSKLYVRPDLLADGDFSDHEEVELLLEAYLMELDNTITRIGLMLKEIDNTEGLITLLLYSSSNELLKLDVVLSLMTTSIGVGSVLTGIFGMNLRNDNEDSHSAFLAVTLCTVLGVALLTFLILLYVKRAKKIDDYT